MYSFANDYSEGAHPDILEALCKTNLEQLPGYGVDHYCQQASDLIANACGKYHPTVYFLAGGTQTNAVVISSMLRPYQGVICASTAHIAVHEAGAIEWTGHKVLPLPSTEGKISAPSVQSYLESFFDDPTHEHMVWPGMVYLSQPTEYGTLYSYSEMKSISDVCRAFHIPLYIDGARLIYALESPANDISLEDMCELTDAFYIGGTKAGLLCGEAVVFPKKNTPAGFITMVKQKGAMMAKGRVLGIQFYSLFSGQLMHDIGKHGIDAAEKLKSVFHKHCIPFFLETPTNQQFVVLSREQAARLSEQFVFERWEVLENDMCAYRFVTSWATDDEAIIALDRFLNTL